MKYAITVIKAVAPFFITSACIYLLGSFISISFNPADWSEPLRLTAVINGLGWGVALWGRLALEGLA